MKQPKQKIQKKLLGTIEKRDGMYVFVPTKPKEKPDIRTIWFPYPQT